MAHKIKKSNHEIYPDEIFLDSSNLPNFDTFQLEGRFEKPIPRSSLVLLASFFVLVAFIFLGKLVILQIKDGGVYRALAENNRLYEIPIFSQRGVIFDRNGVPLVWNVSFPDEDVEFSKRVYIDKKGFAHILGYIGYPQKDSAGFFYNSNFEGKDGVELYYADALSGSNGLRIIETDALGEVQSEGSIRPYENGKDITLTIDRELQEVMYREIETLAKKVGFNAGAGIIMDIKSGELLVIVSYPEYDPNILSEGVDVDSINRFFNDEGKPFLNRAISGLYAPGSIIKPIIAISALAERVITPDTKILSTGSISIPNPYDPEKESVFIDWKAHGWVDMREALAVSSNVYFYEIGGGFEDQEGVGIGRMEAYFKLFGLSKKTGVDLLGEGEGVIPTPSWKREVFSDEWRVGDTYNTAIGQYGFQVTPIQIVHAISTIANNGVSVTPHVRKSFEENNIYGEKVILEHKIEREKIRYVDEEHYSVIREGMRLAVTAGTARGLNIPTVNIAAKTGTAEVGMTKKRVNSWVTGFFPYEEPRYAFVVVMERGPSTNLIGGLYVMRQVFDWMAVNKAEYLKVLETE